MKSTVFTLLATLAIIPFICYSADSGPYSTEKPQDQIMLYKLQPGDTIRVLARRFLGGEEFFTELLEYNKIKNPLQITEGFMLMIPGQEREYAIDMIIKSRQILVKAADAQAKNFAREEFSLANDAIEAAEDNRRVGAYDKATALAQLGLARAQHAINLADERARVQQGGTITDIFGQVEISANAGTSWKNASINEKFTSHTVIRTDSESRAELTFDDGSVIQLLESSRFTLHDFTYDRRNGKRTSQLQLILGNIIGKIKPKQVEESTFEVKSGSTTLAIRGTNLRVGINQAQTARISVLDGDILVNGNQKEITIPENFGTFVEEGRPPADPIELLPPPKIRSPAGDDYETAAQTVVISWEHLQMVPPKMTQRVTNYLLGKSATYHLEIATDISFNQIIQNHITKKNNLQTSILEPNDYYWRLSSIDNNGLEGPPTQVKKLHVFRDLTVKIVPEVAPIEQNGQWIIPPTNTLEVMPVHIETSVRNLELSLNNEPFDVFDGKILINEDGQYLLRVRGVGADGYLGDVVQKEIEVDGTPPIITIDVSSVQDDPNLGQVVYVELEATDTTGIRSLEYKIDDQDYRPYTEKIMIKVSREPGGIYLKGDDVFGKVFMEKNLRRALKTKIHCHAIDLVGNESFETISLKY